MDAHIHVASSARDQSKSRRLLSTAAEESQSALGSPNLGTDLIVARQSLIDDPTDPEAATGRTRIMTPAP